MRRYVMLLEIGRKQKYIFSSNIFRARILLDKSIGGYL